MLNSKMRKEKRGLSPVIATVLLIVMVIALALIVFLWIRSFTQESLTKFGTNVDQVCSSVQFEASYSSGTLELSNTGNVPIYSFNLVTENTGSGSTNSEDLSQAVSDWPKTGLVDGGTYSGDISGTAGSASKITVVPVLRGTSTAGAKSHICASQYGKEVL